MQMARVQGLLGLGVLVGHGSKTRVPRLTERCQRLRLRLVLRTSDGDTPPKE